MATSIVFYTSTALPKACLFTVGINVKMKDDAIGTFGTGLKYTIPIIIRLGGTMVIDTYENGWRKNITFEVETESVRGKEFQFINAVTKWMDGETTERMPMTTDYGKTWEPWMALRELYSNTIDENGEVWLSDDDGVPPPPHDRDRPGTYITVECDAIIDAWHDRYETWLLDTKRRKLVWSCDTVDVYKHSGPFYYKGIRVSQNDVKGALTYNIKRNVQLTEDRTFSASDFSYDISPDLLQMNNKNACYDLLMASGEVNKIETGFHFSRLRFENLSSKEMREEAMRLYKAFPQQLSSHLKGIIKEMMAKFNFDELYTPVALNEQQKKRLLECVKLLAAHGANIRPKYTVRICTGMDGLYGQAMPQRKMILLNPELTLDSEPDWKQTTTETLLEEYIHLEFECGDYSRTFQDRLLTMMFQMMTTGKVVENSVRPLSITDDTD